MNIEDKLKLLRKQWVQHPEKRDIIERMARALILSKPKEEQLVV